MNDVLIKKVKKEFEYNFLEGPYSFDKPLEKTDVIIFNLLSMKLFLSRLSGKGNTVDVDIIELFRILYPNRLSGVADYFEYYDICNRLRNLVGIRLERVLNSNDSFLSHGSLGMEGSFFAIESVACNDTFEELNKRESVLMRNIAVYDTNVWHVSFTESIAEKIIPCFLRDMLESKIDLIEDDLIRQIYIFVCQDRVVDLINREEEHKYSLVDMQMIRNIHENKKERKMIYYQCLKYLRQNNIAIKYVEQLTQKDEYHIKWLPFSKDERIGIEESINTIKKIIT